MISLTRGVKLLSSSILIGWVVLNLSCRQELANFCQSMPQPWPWARSWNGHPVHFPRPIYPFSQICKVWHKQFWCERQQSLWWQTRRQTWWRTQQRTRGKWTENIKSPQTVAGGYWGKSMLNSMLVHKDFQTWLLIGWRLCCQTIRKSLETIMDFNMEIS